MAENTVFVWQQCSERCISHLKAACNISRYIPFIIALNRPFKKWRYNVLLDRECTESYPACLACMEALISLTVLFSESCWVIKAFQLLSDGFSLSPLLFSEIRAINWALQKILKICPLHLAGHRNSHLRLTCHMPVIAATGPWAVSNSSKQGWSWVAEPVHQQEWQGCVHRSATGDTEID